MPAARAHRDRDALALVEVDRPEAGPAAVVVEAKSAGVAYGVLARAQHLFRYSRE
jgi:D-arabinose 1-dehydrogenase-like Zn-dependent alcohol dehydrogenase